MQARAGYSGFGQHPAALFILVCAALGGCAAPQPRHEAAATAPVRTDAARLRQRAEQLWQARVDEDWETVFRFEVPEQQKDATAAEFADWSRKNEPFKYESFEIVQVQAEPPLGWVNVKYRSSQRRFPNVPARDSAQWQKWHVVAGDWLPVRKGDWDDYPAAPAQRDAAEEARLRARVDEAWEARTAHDWHQLYGLTDPRDHQDITEDAFAKDEALFEHLSRNLRWIEVVGDRGRVRALYDVKSNDESLTKMPIQSTELTEPWVKYDGQWYRDLITGR